MKHAEVKVSGYTVPLIGVPPTAMLEECDLCHDYLSLQSISYNGKQFLCTKCMKTWAEEPPTEQAIHDAGRALHKVWIA